MAPATVAAVGLEADVATPGATGEGLMRRGKSLVARGTTPPPLPPAMGVIAPPMFTLTGICKKVFLINMMCLVK